MGQPVTFAQVRPSEHPDKRSIITIYGENISGETLVVILGIDEVDPENRKVILPAEDARLGHRNVDASDGRFVGLLGSEAKVH